MKPAYHPSKKRRKRQHGFLARIKTKSGRATLSRRRAKGRKRLLPKMSPRKFHRHTEA